MHLDFVLNSSPEIGEAARRNTVVLVPVGQTEEHGPHLPVGTDTFIAHDVARKVAAALEGEIPILVMPPVWSAFSVDTLGQWPGLIKVRSKTFIDLIHDIVASLLRMGFRKVIIMNGHGNNPEFLQVALRELADEFEATPIMANVWRFGAEKYQQVRRTAPGGSCHACEYETSMVLALGYPVDMSKAPAGDELRFDLKFRAKENLFGSSMVTWSTWKLQQSRSGVYGDPTTATVEMGEQVLQATVDQFVELVREYYAWEPEPGEKE